MPVPINDVIAAMRVNAEKTETALQKVSNAYRTHYMLLLMLPLPGFFRRLKLKLKLRQ